MTVLAWVAVYLAVSVVGIALCAAAIRHGEQQACRERAQLLSTTPDQP